jgi:hypothetical protein
MSPGTGWPGYNPRHWVPFSSTPTTFRATVEVFDTSSCYIAYHYPRKHLLNTLYPRKRRLGFQESISTETRLPTCSLALGLHVTVLIRLQQQMNIKVNHVCKTPKNIFRIFPMYTINSSVLIFTQAFRVRKCVTQTLFHKYGQLH